MNFLKKIYSVLSERERKRERRDGEGNRKERKKKETGEEGRTFFSFGRLAVQEIELVTSSSFVLTTLSSLPSLKGLILN